MADNLTTTEKLLRAKGNAVLQAQIWEQEAHSQRHTVLEILRYFDLPERDWEALRLIREKLEGSTAGVAPSPAPSVFDELVAFEEAAEVKPTFADAVRIALAAKQRTDGVQEGAK